MANREWEVVKSTLDFLVREAIRAAGLEGAVGVTEVEDVAEFEKVLQASGPAIVYQVVRMNPDPRPPKYLVGFNVGAKTTDDGANVDMTKLIADLNATFREQERFNLYDYTGDASEGLPIHQRGAVLITSADITPQQFDKMAGLRMISCQAKAVCSAG